MKKYLLGLDAGTTAFKGGLFEADGRCAASAQRDYTLLTPNDGWVEFPAEEYWRALCALVRELLDGSGAPPESVAGLALSSQGETLICLDEAGAPLDNAIVWLDNRAVAEADELRARFGRQAVYEITGQADMLATWPAAKLLWLKRNRPEIFGRTARFLLLEDYLLFKLTGGCFGEPNLWASSAMLNIHSSAWWAEMLAALEITPRVLPELLPCGSLAGGLSAQAAAQTGLAVGTPVAMGALDQTCNAIGCGLTRPGIVCETTGSCLSVSAVLDTFPPFDHDAPLTCQNHAVPGRYTALLWSQSAGMTLKWFAREFYKECGDLDAAFARMNAEAAKVPMGCGGLTMLPHLTGASHPEYDPFARGVFCGATLEHGRAHFTRAIMEAVACMLRRNLDQLEALGVDFDAVYCTGGGANSPLWLSIKADVAGKAMLPLRASESACLGAAVLAGVAVGFYEDVDVFADSVARLPPHAPGADAAEASAALFDRYIALYDALKPYFYKCQRKKDAEPASND